MTSFTWGIERVLPETIVWLHHLISFPSISSDPAHDKDVAECAVAVSEVLTSLGCSDVKLLEAGGKPAVYGHIPAPAGQPTVLLYAHYDVQPVGDKAAWDSPPFEATERAGRLYARGAADDKGGLAVHLATLALYDGKPPVGLKILVEGEEEIGSPTISALLEKYHDELSADVFVVTDAINWEVGKPTLTTSLRGVVDAVVEVSTSTKGLHSGQFGGVVPDANTALCRLLATLHDDAGNVAIQGLVHDEMADLEYPEDRLRAESGILAGVDWVGQGSLVQRMWGNPAVSVLALDATRVADASNTLAPNARAKVSLRIAPSQDPARAADLLKEHLLANAPWGAKVEVEIGQVAAGTKVALVGPAADSAKAAFRDAYAADPIEVGVGGSIPVVAAIANQYPEALTLVTAVVDPTSQMHADNESVDLTDLAKAADAQADLLNRLGQ